MSKVSKSTVQSPEDLLKRLRRLDSNMTCPNCDTRASQGIGFGNVCVKYRTFICDLCKTSHQAISHRVKSVSMSTWTIEEVRELMDESGGGNLAARHSWLLLAPPCGSRYPGGSRPKDGDRIENFKQFVIDCYELGKFKASDAYIPSPPVSTQTVSPARVRPDVNPVEVNRSFSPQSRPAPLPCPTIDLLEGIQTAALTSQPADLDLFSASFPPPNSSPQPPISVQTFPPAFDPFQSSQSPVMPPHQPAFSEPFNQYSSQKQSVIPTYDPFGNDLLIPITSKSGALSSNNSAGDLSSLYSTNPPSMASPSRAQPMALSMNSGLAISCMGPLVHPNPSPMLRGGIVYPQNSNFGNYPSPQMMGSMMPRGPVVPGRGNFDAVNSYSGLYTKSSNAGSVGAFDFVDAELKASIRR